MQCAKQCVIVDETMRPYIYFYCYAVHFLHTLIHIVMWAGHVQGELREMLRCKSNMRET